MIKLRSNIDRLMHRLNALAEIGAIPGGGCNRQALTVEDGAGRDLVVRWMHDLGMTVTVDAIGNVIARRAGSTEERPVMTGSHTDTVATGGRYDGNLGVLAGLEVVEVLNEAGIVTRRPIEVAIFTNEEGSRFKPDVLGSLVYVGGMDLDTALTLKAKDGARLGDDLKRIGYAGPAAVPGPVPHAFVELHIEQGPILEAEGVTIGAVEDLQGILWLEIQVEGQSNHAGTTPMHLRHDAGVAAARLVTFARTLALEVPGQVATCGALSLKPGLVNVVPPHAVMTLDLRNPSLERLHEVESRLMAEIEQVSADEGVTINVTVLARFDPVIFDADLVGIIETHARELGHSVRRMTSGACHDAQMLARVCPTAMIFVPSHRGISHNVTEHTDVADLHAGTEVLLRTMLTLAD